MVSENRGIVGHTLNDFVRKPVHPWPALLVDEGFGTAAEFDFDRPFGSGDFPGIAIAQPLVSQLDLLSVAQLLMENTELIANPVSQAWNLQRRQGIEVTGGKSTKATIAETGFCFLSARRSLTPAVYS